MERVRGVPDLLDAYSEDTLPLLDRLRDLLDEYRAAVAAYNAAEPNDLGGAVADRSGSMAATVDALEVLDRIPAAFGAALRELDAAHDPAAHGPALPLAADADGRLRRLILDGVAGPAASGAERARIATILRRWDAIPDAPSPLTGTTRAEDWRSASNQLARLAGNSLLAVSESRRLADLRIRYPVSRPWIDVTAFSPATLARTGGTHNRPVLQAARHASEATTALRTNTPLLPTLGVRIPPALLTAGKLTSRAVGGVGIGLSAVDGYQDYREGDIGGVLSNTAAVGGGALMLIGGPITITTGAVLIVGSMIYEAHRETIDAAVRATGDRLQHAARTMSDYLGF